MYSKRVLSIDIGTSDIKIVVGKQLKKAILVEKLYKIPTPANSYQDGELVMLEKIEKAVRELLVAEKIKAKKAICTISSSSVITREIVVPSAKPKELKNLVHFEIQQYLPIIIEDHLIEFKIIEEFFDEAVKKVRILAAILPKKMSVDYLKLLSNLKLQPVALDIHDNAISKIFDGKVNLNGERSSLDKTVAVIDLGHSHINLIIIDRGVQRFSRIIPKGGKNININIANSFNLAVNEAEEKKIEHVDLENFKSDLSSYDMINELIRSNIDTWIEEIQRIFKYYTSRNMGNKIDEIYIYGGNSKIKGIAKFFNTMLNIPTFRVEEISNIKLAKKLEAMDLDYYLNAVAGIMRR
ncbi:type IV pilus assembly protein PilM [Wukongibacter baidiensis]|uniref:type IV pilus assembly protein PilM n=1 Tax=Wukongibacter baidiensis TaxID=1723361 RepID=UPI003D7F5AE7